MEDDALKPFIVQVFRAEHDLLLSTAFHKTDGIYKASWLMQPAGAMSVLSGKGDCSYDPSIEVKLETW